LAVGFAAARYGQRGVKWISRLCVPPWGAYPVAPDCVTPRVVTMPVLVVSVVALVSVQFAPGAAPLAGSRG